MCYNAILTVFESSEAENFFFSHVEKFLPIVDFSFTGLPMSFVVF